MKYYYIVGTARIRGTIVAENAEQAEAVVKSHLNRVYGGAGSRLEVKVIDIYAHSKGKVGETE